MIETDPRAADARSGPAVERRPALGRGLKSAIVAAVLVGAAAVLYVIGASLTKPGGGGSGDSLQALAQGPMSKLQPAPQGLGYPATAFVDADGKTLTLAAFKGKAVVLNLWATWCAPCRKEMPTLAALQRDEAGKPLQVVAVSMDQPAQTDAAKAFIAGQAPLKFYQDAHYGFLSTLQPHLVGFPTTVLFDRNGVERAVMMGQPCMDDAAAKDCAAGWDSPQAKALMAKLMTM